ncbi:hypothetical protein IMZ48_33075 [Candidatus Bathyarchaeota archaeon]|nr:hypothetical protein [Candidatus Bathyarchaeota archaeon]
MTEHKPSPGPPLPTTLPGAAARDRTSILAQQAHFQSLVLAAVALLISKIPTRGPRLSVDWEDVTEDRHRQANAMAPREHWRFAMCQFFTTGLAPSL